MDIFVDVVRDEILKSKVTVDQLMQNKDSGKIITRKQPVYPGTDVRAQYFVEANYVYEKKLTGDDFSQLDNALRSLILLKGEECINEKTIAKYLKECTGIAVKNLQITTAIKRYLVPACRPDDAAYKSVDYVEYYYSDEIDLLSPITTTKNI